MDNSEDRFEEYLRTFRGPAPPSDIGARVRAQYARRRVRFWACSGVCATAAILFVTLASPVQQPRSTMPESSVTQTSRAQDPPPTPRVRVDRGSLMLAYGQGGVETLFAQLDLASSQFSTAPKNLEDL